MKKLISIILIAAAAVSVLVMPVSANAAAKQKVYKSGSFKYVTSAKAAKIVKYVGKGGKVTIPSKLGGKTVIGVAHDSFKNSKITSVKFPNTVTAIGNAAFDSCYSLRSVKLSNRLQSIGEHAFWACNELKSIKLPDSVKKIGRGLFLDCDVLKSVTLSKNITQIPDFCFSHTSIKSLTLPAACKKIGTHAFEESKLETLTLGKNFKTISEEAFYFVSYLKKIKVSKNNPYYCSKDGVLYNKKMTELVLYPRANKAKEFTVPSTVKSIGDEAFHNSGWGVTYLKKINLPKGLKRIGDYAFTCMEKLREAKIPSKVEYIGIEAFYETSISEVKIPKSVKYISDKAFSYTKAETIDVDPNPELELGEKVFAGCHKLTKVTLFPVKDSDGYTFHYCGHLEEVEIPDTITTIYEYDFYDCIFTEITIPDTVKKIETGAFGYEYIDPEGTYEIEDFTIRGSKGSAAEKYAKENGFTFEEI